MCALGLLPEATLSVPASAAAVSAPDTVLKDLGTAAGAAVIDTVADVCRDTKVMIADFFTGPADGRRKVVLGLVGSSNQLQIVDVSSGSVEASLTFPVISEGAGVRDLVCAPAVNAVIATAGTDIVKVNLGDHSWKSLGKVTANQNTRHSQGYEPRLDSEGRVWIGNYPDAAVVRIDPTKDGADAITYGALAGEGAQYSRHVAVIGDTVYAGVGATDPRIVAFDRTDPSRVVAVIRHPEAAKQGFAHYVTALDETHLAVEMPLGAAGEVASLIYDTATRTWTTMESAPFNFQLLAHPSKTGQSLAITSKGVLFIMDNVTGKKVADVATLPSRYVRKMAVLYGQEVGVLAATDEACVYCEVDLASGQVRNRRDLSPTPAGMISQAPHAPDDEDALYLGTYQGRGLTRLDLASKRITSTVGALGQVESVVFENGTMLAATYERSRVWSLGRPGMDGAKQLVDLGAQDQSRPLGLALAAGKVCVGSVAGYGINGGGLALVDRANGTAEVLRDLVDQQSVVGLVGDGKDTVYATTSVRGGFGTKSDGPGPAHVLAYDVRQKRELWRVQVAGENVLNDPLLAEGVLYVSTPFGVLVVDPATGGLREYLRLRASSQVSGYRMSTLSYSVKERLLVHTDCYNQLTRAIDPAAKTTWLLAKGTLWSTVRPSTGRALVSAGETSVSEVAVRL